MEIDNFDILMEHMDFVDPNDRYIVHIMRRPKDCKKLKNQLGSNEAQRLIRTYYVDNKDYLLSKKEAIKELCNSCNARAYLIVQPKDNFECLLNLGKKILETIQNKNYSVKPEHLLRQAYCENHKSRKKLWILDLDDDCMDVYTECTNIRNPYVVSTKHWSKDDVVKLVKDELRAIQELELKKHPRIYATWLEDQVYEVKTKNGCHIITPPFNLKSAYSKCSMMFEGEKTFIKKIPCGPDEYDDMHEKRVGWLHKDGMTLLYANLKDEA